MARRNIGPYEVKAIRLSRAGVSHGLLPLLRDTDLAKYEACFKQGHNTIPITQTPQEDPKSRNPNSGADIPMV